MLNASSVCLYVCMYLCNNLTMPVRDLSKVQVRFRPNAASGGWSYGRDYVMMTYEGDTRGPDVK